MMTRTSRTSLRRAAIGAATAATVFSGAAVLASFPASAAEYNGRAVCAKFVGTDEAVRCEIRELDREIAAAKKDTARIKQETGHLQQQSARDREISECAGFLVSLAKAEKTPEAIAAKRTEILNRAGGKIVDGNACSVARSYGFRRKEAEALPSIK